MGGGADEARMRRPWRAKSLIDKGIMSIQGRGEDTMYATRVSFRYHGVITSLYIPFPATDKKESKGRSRNSICWRPRRYTCPMLLPSPQPGCRSTSGCAPTKGSLNHHKLSFRGETCLRYYNRRMETHVVRTTALAGPLIIFGNADDHYCVQ